MTLLLSQQLAAREVFPIEHEVQFIVFLSLPGSACNTNVKISQLIVFFLSTGTLSLSLAQHAMQMSKALKAAILRSALLSHFCFAPLFTLDNNNICTRCKCQCTHTNMRKLNAPTSKYTHSQSHSQSHSH